jgi:hypothetical protein
MPICLNRKIAFIHIPKTAGSTIEKALGLQNIENLYQEKKFKNYLVCPQHLTCGELSNEIDLAGYDIFTIVRNPYDRLVSEFYHMKNNEWLFKLRDLPFQDFIYSILDLDPIERKYIFDGHLEPQCSFIENWQDKTKVFKYENLIECFEYLDSMYGPLQFGHEKKCHKEKIYNWTSELKQAVYSLYWQDFEKFEYSA